MVPEGWVTREALEWALLTLELLLAGSAAGFALTRRRGPTGTIAWLLAILVFPIGGALAYFALANPHVARPRRRKLAAARRVRAANPIPDDPVSLTEGDGSPLMAASLSVMRGVARATGLPPTYGNQADVLTENVAAFAAKERAIREARRTIWAEYYIVHGDDTGRRFLTLLADRARDGLDVRLLVDAVGSADIDASALQGLRDAGGKVEVFHPVNPLRRRWAVHLRNHRKILVCDGRVAFVGGMNIGDRYAGSAGAGRAQRWRDTHLRVEGPAARDLAQVFDEDWCFMVGEPLTLPEPSPPVGSTTVAILPSGPDQAENATGLAWFSAITLAVERCWLTTPYFVPDVAILRALTGAARRGVDVRLLVPRRSDVALLSLVNRSYYPALLEAGVRVFEYQPGTLHAKTIVVDGELTMIGSANVDIRSFQLNFEAGAVIADEGFARRMEEQFTHDLAESREVKPGTVRRAGPVSAVLQGAAQLLSPLL